jgi:hypothetical protein
MVQQRKKTLAIRSLVLVLLCTTLFAFSERIGVDSFTIYLNDELMLQEYVTPGAKVKDLLLTGIDAPSGGRPVIRRCHPEGMFPTL